MTGIPHAGSLVGIGRAAALLALAAGCDTSSTSGQGSLAQEQPQRRAEGRADGGDSSAPARRPVDLGTFSVPQEPTREGGLESRLPAEPERTILVADSALYPGATRLDPGIENPFNDQEAIDAGQRHFSAFNCDGCHAPLGGGGMGPPLSDGEWIHGSEPAQIYLSIMHGRPEGMPSWSSMLPARTVWELVAYIQTLDEIENHAAERGFELRGSSYALGAADDQARSGNAGEEAGTRSR